MPPPLDAVLALTVLAWIVTHPAPTLGGKTSLTLALIGLVVVTLSLTRNLDALAGILTASRPPEIWRVALALAGVAALAAGLMYLAARRQWPSAALIALLFGVLIVLKTEPLALAASTILRRTSGQSADLASALDIRWLGISYVAFRLIHTLRDRQLGLLPELALDEYVSYVLFFPTLTAGPIDRAERFVKDLRASTRLAWADAVSGGGRIALGLFKKFVLADALALFALDGTRATQTSSTGWLWVMLYAYAFRIFLDFSGYSDIAIGLGRLAGFAVPENFDSPYLKPTLTAFWNSWHMTLAYWFRTYYFHPVSRALVRTKQLKLPTGAMIAFTQITTMILIGLWHQISLPFVIWGAWHGVGLFVHNRWAARTRQRAITLETRPCLKRLVDGIGVLVVFHFVTLGWVWFALPTVDQGWRVFVRLFGG